MYIQHSSTLRALHKLRRSEIRAEGVNKANFERHHGLYYRQCIYTHCIHREEDCRDEIESQG